MCPRHLATHWGTSVVLLVLLAVGPGPAEAQRGDLFQGAEREEVRDEIERLAEIQARHRDAIFLVPGVHGMGIGADRSTRELRFVVLTTRENLVSQIPLEIEGIAAVSWVTNPPAFLDGPPDCGDYDDPCHTDQKSLPVEMDNSRGPESVVLPWPYHDYCDTCTLGFKVCSYGTHYYVTAGHCSRGNDGCPAAATFGTDTYHVGAFDVPPPEQCTITQDMEKVGTVVAHAYPACGAQNAKTDAALIQSSDALTSWAIRDIGTPNTSPGWALPEDDVQKSGRTTGHTFGTVWAVNVELAFTPGELGCCFQETKWVDQILVAAPGAVEDEETKLLVDCDELFILSGDSGSALLRGNSIVGVLTFGDRVDGCWGAANRVQDVIDALGLCAASCDQELQDCLANCPQPGGCQWCNQVYLACCRQAALTPNCS